LDKEKGMSFRRNVVRRLSAVAVAALFACQPLLTLQALAQEKKPNIIFIMGDDIRWSNIGVYNQGIMAGRTPNLDRRANEGMRFTMPRRAALQDVPTSSLANCRSAPV
jgi:hypothetical protein